MASDTRNPFANPIGLPAPASRIHARKPSRSPVRQHVRESDALLRDLSPTSTLRAFVNDPSDMGPSADFLASTIRSATMSERDLGAKAAQTCLDLRNWTREIEQWQWPGTFEQPEPARKRVQLDSTQHAGDEEEEHWGSLPARVVQEYERRADEIGQSLDDVDVEELKAYLLNSHFRLNSRPSSRANCASEYSSAATDCKKLDDFTALVTATILQALPFLSRLSQLLDTWTIRLIILRGAPRFLHDLKLAQSSLDKCWAAITPPSGNDVAANDGAKFTKAALSTMKSSIENLLGTLARRLDRFLDALEGRNECVPDSWIDDFESCEASYSAWVVQAERTAAQHEWGRQLHMPSTTHDSFEGRTGLLLVSETEDPTSDDDAVRRPSQSVRSSVDEAPFAKIPLTTTSAAPHQPGLAELSVSGSRTSANRAVSAPLSVTSHLLSDVLEEHDSEGQADLASLGIERSASTESRSKEETTGAVAAKRAAFLRDIERNQSLNKSTLSPVRPFERASNAFTRLFKKEKGPEQVVPRRTASRLAEGRASSAESNALSPVSFASSRFNSASPTVSTQSAANSSKSSMDDAEDSLPNASSSRDCDLHNDSSSQREDCYAQEVPSAVSTLAVAPKYQSSGSLSSPFHSPEKKDLSEQWPLSPSAEVQPSAPLGEFQRRVDEFETPSMTIDTDVFHRTFIEGIPGSETHKVAPISAGVRRASLPLAQPLPPGNAPPSSKPIEWAPMARAERHASTSPARPRTAPSSAFKRAPGNATMTRHISDFRVEPLQLESAGSMQWKVPNDTEISDGETTSSFKVKRASVASIEAFSRSELKSIDVPKSSRQSSVSPPHTPAGLSRPPSDVARQKRASLDNDTIDFAASTNALPSPRRSSLPSQVSPLPELSTSGMARSSPVMEHKSAPFEASSPPLNIAMKKIRGSKTTGRPSSPFAIQGESPAVTPTHADQFDRHVSEVLERLPAPIRFKARAGAETPIGRLRGYSGTRPKASTVRVASKGGDMTIAPAESCPKKSRLAADSEVKLYHLTHTGREDPIKLFVRLVGEGERVMVRVGGGWADLADYLRDFASHHGSRTVSEGNLEIATLPSAPLSTRKFSNPADYQRAKTPTTPREVRPGSSDDDTPLKRPPFDLRESAVRTSDFAADAGMVTSSTPKSSKSGSSNSRPSTACDSRPSSRQAQFSSAAEVGLSGPSSAAKRAVLPADKARWVEGMISRAKNSASAEKSKEDKEKYFNEMGKAGGTRRVIFRSGSGTGPLQDKTNK